MLKWFKADLHIHSCLSPCAEIDMTPLRIIRKAAEQNIHFLAITDHNSSRNIETAMEVASQYPVIVFPGMEVTTSEEVHLIALFEEIETMKEFQKIVDENLMEGENDELRYGYQIVVNTKDEILDFEKRLLINSTMLSTDTFIDTIHSLNGVIFASHIDREHFSIISQLGFIPEWLKIDALEVSPSMEPKDAFNLYGENKRPLVSFSDAHYLRDIGHRYTEFYLVEASFQEMKKALQGESGRKIAIGF